jgi:molecular chaperone DnaK
MRIINEPTAASSAYGIEKKKNERIVVFRSQAVRSNVSVLDVADGFFQVMSTNGDTHLGGDDFDQVLIDYIAEQFEKRERVFDLR